MRLSDEQIRFTGMVARLILHAEQLGYGLTLGDGYRDPRVFGSIGVSEGYGHPESNHKRRLAVDFNLFDDGVYVIDPKPYEELHEYWRSIGGSTIEDDLNHFSIKYRGIV